MDGASEAAVQSRYQRLYVDYRATVTALYLSGDTLAGSGPVFSWKGDGGIQAAEEPPLQTFLAPPKLAPNLAQYLPKQE